MAATDCQLERQEQELARQLGGFGAKVDLADPWVSLDDLRGEASRRQPARRFRQFPALPFRPQAGGPPYQPARYVAWLIPPAGKAEIQMVDLGEAAKIEPLVAAARKGIDGSWKEINNVGEAAAEKNIQRSFRELAVAVLDPVLAKAGGAKRLILSPDGASGSCRLPPCRWPMADIQSSNTRSTM